MNKILTRVAVSYSIIFLLATTANAQLKKPGITLGGNFIYSMPKGKFNDAYSFGVGGELFGGVGWGSTYLIGTVGFAGYKARSGNSAGTLTTVPVKVGLKKYFLLKKIFINGDLGVSTVKAQGVGRSAFTAGFGGGVRLFGLEAGLYYNAFKNKKASGYSASGYSNSVNVKLGWSISL